MRCDEVIRELAVPTDERDSTALAEHLACCPACGVWANRVVGLDHLWEATRLPEPSSEVWDALWARLAPSLDVSTPNQVSAFAPFMQSQNGSSARGGTQTRRPRPSSRARLGRWAMIGLIGLAQAAAVLLAVGLSWRGFGPSQPPQVAHVAGSTPSPSLFQGKESPRLKLVSIVPPSDGFPTVVEEGRLVVIHADAKPRKILVPIVLSSITFVIQVEGQVPTVVDLTRDGMSFGVDDWYLVFNAVESLANPVVVMKE